MRFKLPTTLGPELEVRGSIVALEGRKVTVASRVLVGGEVTVEGDAVVLEVSERFGVV